MSKWIYLGGIGFFYLALLRPLLWLRHRHAKAAAFAALNLGAVWLLFYGKHLDLTERFHAVGPVFWIYLGTVFVQALMIDRLSKPQHKLSWIPLLFPVFFLALVKYVPAEIPIFINQPFGAYLGLSYMAFRLSYLALEVRNEVVPKPLPMETIGFAFFLPTMFVGPISPYRTFQDGYAHPTWSLREMARPALRIFVGFVKYRFLSSLCVPLTFGALWNDGRTHGPLDFIVSCVAYYLFLYCNFSGACDMAIGIAGLLGIRVNENFRNPFLARNIREFWNRWHITLSEYMRDLVFTPLSVFLGRLLPAKYLNHVIAFSVATVFILLGIWHGTGWNYVYFGCFHAAGVVTVHYYGIWLKKKLGKRLRDYLANPWITAGGRMATFAYASLSFFFFSNNVEQMRKVLSLLRWN